MVASSVIVNNQVQVLPNPCALTILPRLEYSIFLSGSLLEKLSESYSAVNASNRQFYEDNLESAPSSQFKNQVEVEACLLRAVELTRVIQQRLRKSSQISGIAQTVSPLVLVVRSVNSDIYSIAPMLSHDLIELSGLMGSIVMDSGSLAEAKFDFKQTNLESKQILAEVNLIVESKIRTLYPNLNS